MQGTSYPQLEKEYDIAKSTLSRWVKKYSEECKYKSQYDNPYAKEIHDLNKKIAELEKEHLKKSRSILLKGNRFMIYRFIDENKEVFGLRWLFRHFNIALNAYYNYLKGNKEKTLRQGYAFMGIGLLFGIVGMVFVLLLCEPAVVAYKLSSETSGILRQMLYAASIVILFQSSNSILTKGTLRGGGDTKVLMIMDSLFLFVVSIPFGYVAGIVLGMPVFWVFFILKADNLCKTIWAVERLRSGKWIKKIKSFE